jgi:hypothetical protein
MNIIPCYECLLFLICKPTYQNSSIVFCDLLHEKAMKFSCEQWVELRVLFESTTIIGTGDNTFKSFTGIQWKT